MRSHVFFRVKNVLPQFSMQLMFTQSVCLSVKACESQKRLTLVMVRETDHLNLSSNLSASAPPTIFKLKWEKH